MYWCILICRVTQCYIPALIKSENSSTDISKSTLRSTTFLIFLYSKERTNLTVNVVTFLFVYLSIVFITSWKPNIMAQHFLSISVFDLTNHGQIYGMPISTLGIKDCFKPFSLKITRFQKISFFPEQDGRSNCNLRISQLDLV